MSYTIAMLFSFSIGIAAIAGWVCLKRMDPAFFPFFILVNLATLNEIISTLSIRYYHTNVINTNIYTLLESFLITWQFFRWNLFSKSMATFFLLILLLTLTWLAENFYIKSMSQFNNYFNIFYGFIVVMMSITMVNRLLDNHLEPMLMRPVLLLCFCFAIYFTYNTLIEIFWSWGLERSKSFRIHVYRILYYVNLVINIIYALVFIWIPKKREFL